MPEASLIAPVILETNALDLSIAGNPVCQQLDLRLHSGQCLGILGQNGTGKTTLLHSLMRFRPVDSGSIWLCQRPLQEWSIRQLATHLGILFQSSHDAMPATVLETAMMSRHPHLAEWQWEAEADMRIAKDALQALGIDAMADRDVSTLSGGERQRLAIASLLTQQPRLFLLDEPGNHLDIAFQIEALSLLRKHVLTRDAALCMATHDMNLAARYCDQILLLLGGGRTLLGPTADILTAANLSIAYGCEIRQIEVEQGRQIFFPA